MYLFSRFRISAWCDLTDLNSDEWKSIYQMEWNKSLSWNNYTWNIESVYVWNFFGMHISVLFDPHSKLHLKIFHTSHLIKYNNYKVLQIHKTFWSAVKTKLWLECLKWNSNINRLMDSHPRSSMSYFLDCLYFCLHHSGHFSQFLSKY